MKTFTKKIKKTHNNLCEECRSGLFRRVLYWGEKIILTLIAIILIIGVVVSVKLTVKDATTPPEIQAAKTQYTVERLDWSSDNDSDNTYRIVATTSEGKKFTAVINNEVYVKHNVGDEITIIHQKEKYASGRILEKYIIDGYDCNLYNVEVFE